MEGHEKSKGQLVEIESDITKARKSDEISLCE